MNETDWRHSESIVNGFNESKIASGSIDKKITQMNMFQF